MKISNKTLTQPEKIQQHRKHDNTLDNTSIPANIFLQYAPLDCTRIAPGLCANLGTKLVQLSSATNKKKNNNRRTAARKNISDTQCTVFRRAKSRRVARGAHFASERARAKHRKQIGERYRETTAGPRANFAEGI